MTAPTAAERIGIWLESTRGADGYGGPVVHWWRDNLVDCRAGHDWRYEGIICGHLALWRRTGQSEWLTRARRAGHDLLGVQTPDGHFTRSVFEQNPGTGGTPHEAAADIGLLELASALRPTEPAAADRYLAAAKRNLEVGQIRRLWDGDAGSFRDDPSQPSFVPNKTCTLLEALLCLAEATGEERWAGPYAASAADAVLALQLRRPGDRLDGAIAQNSFGRTVVAKYFPYYVARCIPGLLAVASFTGEGRYAEAALAAGRFVARCREPDGGFPQVLYEGGRVNRGPRWVAAVGDVLRALAMLRPFGLDFDAAPTDAWLAAGLRPCGAVRTARGFAGQGMGERAPDDPPELRDVLPVAGWTDKAFRYLAGRAEELPAGDQGDEIGCRFRGRRLRCRIGLDGVEVTEGRRIVYRWLAGAPWAEAEPWLVLR